jgi:hypothetical protein
VGKGGEFIRHVQVSGRTAARYSEGLRFYNEYFADDYGKREVRIGVRDSRGKKSFLTGKGAMI